MRSGSAHHTIKLKTINNKNLQRRQKYQPKRSYFKLHRRTASVFKGYYMMEIDSLLILLLVDQVVGRVDDNTVT